MRKNSLQNLNMNCTAANDPHKLYTWGFYLIATVYNLVTFCISCYYLVYGLPWEFCKFSKFIRLLIFDGMQYFLALTAVNILNILVYRSKNRFIQSSAAPFGYLITWIMSQRILIHMRESASEKILALPVLATFEGLGLSAASSHEAEVSDGRGGARPRYEETDPEGTLRKGDTPGIGKISLPELDGRMPPDEPQHTRQSDGDDVR